MPTITPDQGNLKPAGLRWVHALAGIFVFLVVAAIGYFVLHLQNSRTQARQKLAMIDFGTALRSHINRELSSVLYLTSGLQSYLVVRHKDLQQEEVRQILANLHKTASHVRTFAVAEGYKVTYVYPTKGNEKVVGLNYPDLPSQWPDVKRTIESGKPFLAGPIDLVQGGSGFIYRVPVFIDGNYWGLLSTVVDADSLMNNVLRDTSVKDITFAVRGRNARGMDGDIFWGDPDVFKRPDIELLDIVVPGGKWVMALSIKSSMPDEFSPWLLHILWIAFALILGAGAVIILRQRDQLTRLALSDTLTGLPNRHLIEDRVVHAISMRRRSRYTICALMFIDLDGFKKINDRYGHKAGDIVLQGVAARVRGAVRDTDTVGRWGGDEIIVLMENVERPRLTNLVEQVRKAVEAPTEFSGHSLHVGASIGLAIAPDDGETLGDLIRSADGKMYDNKMQRRAAAAA